jgi:hypothetical protein
MARRPDPPPEPAPEVTEPSPEVTETPHEVTEAAPTQEEENAWAARTAALNAENAAMSQNVQADFADKKPAVFVAEQTVAPEQQAAPVDLPGAQVVLDPEGDAAKAARGELYEDMRLNTLAYQASPETP